jgi:hypothetical protein
MDVTPASDPSKRPRAKSALKSDAPKPVRKTLTTSRKKSPPAAAVVSATPDIAVDLNRMIETAAFYLAAERGFAPGHELEDWLEAERRIRAHYPL